MAELLEAKVKVSGAEEAATEYAQAAQRAVQAAESIGTGADQRIEIDKLLAEAGLGPIQDVRQYTEQVRREIDEITKQWVEVHKKAEGVGGGRGGKPQRARALEKIRKALAGFDKKYAHVSPEMIAGDIQRGMGSLLGMLTPGIAGVGGILGLMLWGVAETQKYEAEANRFVQIFDQSVRSYSGKAEQVDRMAAGRLAKVAKDLEISFGATRGELEAAERAFADSGISAGEAGEKITKAYGAQMQSLYELTVGLERHFELASGTAGRQATEFMVKYGYTNKEAADAVVQLNFAGARSGVGISNYTNAIMQATAGVRQLGVNSEQVIGLTEQFQKQYERMGIKHHLAGGEALQATQQILSGLAGLSIGEQVMVAERMGKYGKGFDARAKMVDEFNRMGGPDRDFLAEFIKAERDIAMEKAGYDPVLARQMLESKFGMKGAKALIEVGDQLDAGLSVAQVDQAALKAFAGTFQTEAQKTELFQKFMRQAMEGMRKVGLALFNILTAGFAEMILSIRMTIAMLQGDASAAGMYAKAMKETFAVFPEAIGSAIEGLGDVATASGQLLDIEGLKQVKKSMEGVTTPFVAAGQEAVGLTQNAGEAILRATPEAARSTMLGVGRAVNEATEGAGQHAVMAGAGGAAGTFMAIGAGAVGPVVGAGLGLATVGKLVSEGSAVVITNVGTLLTGGQRNARGRTGRL